ncbi:MAG: Gfo/Idh/MocA family oxidoreductase, partial [Daejeonella sp.]
MKIVLIGSGNVATQLGRSFKMVGQEIVQVWSRTLENARKLAESLASEAVSDLSKIMDGAD